METRLKTITVREAYEALVQNGMELARETWLTWDSGKIVGGCILGQTAINLGVIPNAHVSDGLDNILDSVNFVAYDLENKSSYSLHDQLNRFKTPEKWDTDEEAAFAPYLQKCANAIEHWNDKGNWYSSDGEAKAASGYKPSTFNWFLKTYEDVAAMAKEVLEPYFDEEITLQVFDYNPFLAPKVL